MAGTTSVYPLQQNTNIDVGATPVEVLVEDKRHTVESTTQPNPVEIIIPSTTVYTVGTQGPPGPPTGLFEEIDNLAFIGSGTGTFKTTTGLYENKIFEEFGVLDELYIMWVIPKGVDRTKSATFEGSFFPLSDEVGTDCSWEIHITAHDHADGEIDGVIYATGLPLEETAHIHSHGKAEIDSTTYLQTADVLHIRLKRVASANDPTAKVGVSDLAIRYATDGKVGIEGNAGPEGPAGGLDSVLFEYNATQGQTVITGVDNGGQTLLYTLGAISFSVNGVELPEEDYVETDTGTITLVEALYADDIVEVVAYAQGEGGGGGDASFDYAATAGENMGAYKLVRIALGTVYLADKDNVAYVQDTLGLTTTVSTTGNPVTIQTSGEVTDVGWAWAAGSVFMGDSGELTQTPSTVGILQKIGTVLTATSILIDIDDPILRA